MSVIKRFLSILIISNFILSNSFAEELKKVGKFKDWETIILNNNSEVICFATSGKSKYKFDITQDNFSWIASNKI